MQPGRVNRNRNTNTKILFWNNSPKNNLLLEKNNPKKSLQKIEGLSTQKQRKPETVSLLRVCHFTDHLDKHFGCIFIRLQFCNCFKSKCWLYALRAVYHFASLPVAHSLPAVPANTLPCNVNQIKEQAQLVIKQAKKREKP